jgi:hypothetical protein
LLVEDCLHFSPANRPEIKRIVERLERIHERHTNIPHEISIRVE